MKKQNLIFIITTTTFVVLGFAFLQMQKSKTQKGADSVASDLPDYSEINVLRTFFKELRKGEGELTIQPGSDVIVSYKSWIYSPAEKGNKGQFLSEVRKENPLKFTIGDKQVIEGLENGLLGMKAGGKREIVIPSEEAYGDQGDGDQIPPGAILLFVVDVIKVGDS